VFGDLPGVAALDQYVLIKVEPVLMSARIWSNVAVDADVVAWLRT
jgi:hypothetical protein